MSVDCAAPLADNTACGIAAAGRCFTCEAPLCATHLCGGTCATCVTTRERLLARLVGDPDYTIRRAFELSINPPTYNSGLGQTVLEVCRVIDVQDTAGFSGRREYTTTETTVLIAANGQILVRAALGGIQTGSLIDCGYLVEAVAAATLNNTSLPTARPSGIDSTLLERLEASRWNPTPHIPLPPRSGS